MPPSIVIVIVIVIVQLTTYPIQIRTRTPHRPACQEHRIV